MAVHPSRLLVLATLLVGSISGELEELASWRFLTFAPPPGFPGASQYGFPVYAPNAVFTGIETTDDRIILSMPRFQPGQPITLGWIPRPSPGRRLPLDTTINAFPDYEWHRAAANGAASAAANCSSLVSVFRTRQDACGRLWVLDSGVSDTLATFTPACLPKLLVFNATTAQLLRRIEFRSEVLRVNSLLTNMAIDSRAPLGNPCSDPDDMFIYMSDTTAPGLVVYDVKRDAAWRVSSPQMFPDPDKGVFTVAGETFTLMDGIIGLALSNPAILPTYRPDTVFSERLLYFQAFASDRIYSVPTSALRARPRENEDLPVKLVGHKSSQAAPIAVDSRDDSLIFSPVTETAVASWQPSQNLLAVTKKLTSAPSDFQKSFCVFCSLRGAPKNESLSFHFFDFMALYSFFSGNVAMTARSIRNVTNNISTGRYQSVKAYNPTLLQCVLDITVDPQDIWMVSTRFQKFFRRTVTAEEVNLRVLRIDNKQQYQFK